MGFLKNAVRNGLAEGISKGIGNGINDAVGKVVESTITPKAQQYADAVAAELDESAKEINKGLKETGEASEAVKNAGGLAGLGAALGLGGNLDELKKNAEDFATQMAKRVKVCTECGEENDGERKFCANCGAQLPEETLADGYVCPECGLQNIIETKFCASCGAVLPAAKEEVERERLEREEENRRIAEEEARQAELKAKADVLKSGANDVKDKAAEIGGQAAEAALDIAGSLFKKMKNRK